jgi:predicted N-acetyltransferase YhbS
MAGSPPFNWIASAEVQSYCPWNQLAVAFPSRQNESPSSMAPNASTASRSGNIRIRRASDGDVEELTRLINAAFVVEQAVFAGDRVDELGVRAYMSSGTFLIAEDSGGPDTRGLVGCVYIETRADRSYLGLLSVQPARQGTGIGRQLVTVAENFARGSGARVMDLRVIGARAEQLLPFYRRLGYEVVRIEPFPADLATKAHSHYILMSKPLI